MRLKELNVQEYMDKVVTVQALIKNAEEKKAKTGSSYVRFMFVDRGTEISAVWFPPDESFVKKYKAGMVVSVDLEINLYNNNVNAKVAKISELIISPDSFMEWFEKYESWVSILDKTIRSIDDLVYFSIVSDLYKEYWSKFRAVPAACSHHHVEFGGAVAHTVFIAVNVEKIANSYKAIYGADLVDVNLVKAAALLHDLLKSEEIFADHASGEVRYSDKAALGSHLTECALAIKESAIKLGLNDNPKVDYLIHCVLAHHGKLEWGSPVTPALPEAMILHHMDAVDAEMWKFQRNIKNLEEGAAKQEFKGGALEKYFRKQQTV